MKKSSEQNKTTKKAQDYLNIHFCDEIKKTATTTIQWH